MATVHKTIRLNAETADRIEAIRGDDETATAVYSRVIEAGLDALEGKASQSLEADKGGETEALRLAVKALTDQLDRQGEQLTAAMDHNAELTAALHKEQETAQAALTLQGIEQTKRLEEPAEGGKRRSLWARIRGKA